MMTGFSSASSNSRKIEDADSEQGSGHDLSRAEYLLTWIAKRISAFLRFARYAYLLRVPIIIAALFLAFPFAALLQKSPRPLAELVLAGWRVRNVALADLLVDSGRPGAFVEHFVYNANCPTQL
jgi:hypothetical protein